MELKKSLVHRELKAMAVNKKDLVMYFPSYSDSKQIQYKNQQ